MKPSMRKPFQEATVDHVLERLCDRRGSRRFLVADEVGLGKTLVAQGVMEGLYRRRVKRPLRVFYMCSSLAVAAQNKHRLLDILSAEERDIADVQADRLDLLPSVATNGEAPFFLYSLTPNTTAGEGTGRMDERVVIGKALQEVSKTLEGKPEFLDKLRPPAGKPAWEARLQSIKIENRDMLKHFRARICGKLGLSPHAWEQTIAERVERSLDEEPRDAVETLRQAMTLAVLDSLRPDLVILDEFQRFFEMLPSAEHDEDEDEDHRWRSAHDMMRAVLGTTFPRSDRPAVLMLSATPYRLFARMREGQQHHEEFFQLLRFLLDDDGSEEKVLRDRFARYRSSLTQDAPGSTRVLALKSEIEGRLLRVMCRTERRRLLGKEAPRPAKRHIRTELKAIDIHAYRHLDESTAEVGLSVEPYWSSIPFPLQAMDHGYALRRHAEPVPSRRGGHDVGLRFKEIRHYAEHEYPHPRLRGLLEVLPGETLCLPWLPPSRPWWPLGGVFERAASDNPSKVLLFSRFRAVPRILSAVLTYEAERAAFGRTKATGQHYDYRARTRAGAEREETEPVTSTRNLDLKRQPAPSFGLSPKGRHGENRRTLLLFLPTPALAKLGDPLAAGIPAARKMDREKAITIVRRRLRQELGQAESDSGNRGRLWRWVATLEARAEPGNGLRAALEQWAQTVAKKHPGAAQTCHDLLREMDSPFPAGERPTARELEELAEMALLGPGNVLFRCTDRVFGAAATPKKRLPCLLDIGLLSLRTYLDAPEWHRFLRVRTRTRGRQGHAERVRHAVWDGNLEAVLDEYLAVLQGFGTTHPDPAREEAALEALERSLALRDAQVHIQELRRDAPAERMRCHAAVPLGLSAADVEDATGVFRGDTLRIAFNSPFRPMALTTTSIGQEGLDFHLYCRNVAHWDLPGNPIDLEQREGRISRYGSLAVRQSLGEQIVDFPADRSPWHALAERLEEEQSADGLAPWWSVPDARTTRTVFIPSFSGQIEHLEDLEADLAFYRLTLGQSDQEHLVRALERRVDTATGEAERRAMEDWLQAAAVDLCPWSRRSQG